MKIPLFRWFITGTQHILHLRIILLLLCFPTFKITTYSQPVRYTSPAALSEKVYLQPDNTVYTTDQTIWFKAVVTNAADHSPAVQTRVLYVELVDPDQNIVDQQRIRLNSGIGSGSIDLSPNYTYGTYQLRAYTRWSQNFGSDFIFSTYLVIAGAAGQPVNNPIQNVTIRRETNNTQSLNLQLNPAMLDSFSGKGVNVYLVLGEQKDTVTIKKNKNNLYQLDYPLPAGCQLVNLQVETSSQIRYSKTIALDTALLDCQLFAESGELVQGLPATLGIKATGYNGKGRPVSGSILNKRQQVIATFQTNHLGMGKVSLEIIDSTEGYSVRVQQLAPHNAYAKPVLASTSVPVSPVPQLFALPSIAATGSTLSVRVEEDQIRLNILSNYLVNDSVSVQATCRGVALYLLKGQLQNGRFRLSIPVVLLPEGVICFTLLSKGKPLAERLFFNRRPETRLTIELATDKSVYQQRDSVSLNITVKDQHEQPSTANLSMLVLNQSVQSGTMSQRQNILSYLLLSSDLKGEIEQPGYYFQDSISTNGDLDALLLTQGWRKYKYQRNDVPMRYTPESSLSVSGLVKGGFSNNKPVRNAELTLMTFGQNTTVAKTSSDSAGRFSFVLRDAYGPGQQVVIQTANKADRQKDYLIKVDKNVSPNISYDYARTVEAPDSVMQAYVAGNISRKKQRDAAAALAGEGVQLGNVTVKAYAMTPKRKEVTDKYGKATRVIEGEDISRMEDKWSYGLFSVLKYHFQDKIRIITISDLEIVYDRAVVSNGLPTLVIIDGIAVKVRSIEENEYYGLQNIPTSEVKSFEIIENAKNFQDVVCECYPPGACNGRSLLGNIIAIYTYAGKGLYGIKPTTGIIKTSVPVFAASKEFYTPKYPQLQPEDWKKPDLRTLIHWQPNVFVNSSGKATLSFYNADLTGKMQVVVEAISATGEIGYHQLLFDVKKRE